MRSSRPTRRPDRIRAAPRDEARRNLSVCPPESCLGRSDSVAMPFGRVSESSIHLRSRIAQPTPPLSRDLPSNLTTRVTKLPGKVLPRSRDLPVKVVPRGGNLAVSDQQATRDADSCHGKRHGNIRSPPSRVMPPHVRRHTPAVGHSARRPPRPHLVAGASTRRIPPARKQGDSPRRALLPWDGKGKPPEPDKVPFKVPF